MGSRKVLLIGWDAADWKIIHPLMDAGRMPNVRRLVENGAAGPVATLHPPLSPMLWTSIATGKRPFQHGIHGFSEPAPDGSGVRPVTNLSRKCKALWNILNQNHLRSVVIGWWPSHPVEPIDGIMVSDAYHRSSGPLDDFWPLPPFTVHPPQLAATLADLRVHPESLDPELVERFIPLAREIDQDRDKRLAAVLRTLAECMSIQSAALRLLDSEPWDFFALYYDAIDHFCHGFMKYHPPRQSWIPGRDFELYRNVVSMAYQFHDEMLGALLEKAGDGVTVVLMSDHGFHPDHLRPSSIPEIPAGPTVEHRDFGILAMEGPGIQKNAKLHGASVLDIAPTILTLYGLPIGGDMDGRPLAQAFTDPPPLSLVPSWEEIPGPDGRHPPHTRLDPVAASEALERMIALGYIERPNPDRELAIARTVRDLRYNLAQAYQDAARHSEAREILAELHQADPGDQRFTVGLFSACQALGMHDEMKRIAAGCEDDAVTAYLNVQVLISEKRYAEALAILEELAGTNLLRPAVFLQTADLYLRLRRPRDAERVYRKALALDPDNPHAYTGLSRLAVGRRDFRAAAHSALDALHRSYQEPRAHLLLGRALAGLGQPDRAADAFRAAISVNPNYPEAHIRLAALLEVHLADPESAREHRRLARAMRNGNSNARGVLVTESAPTAAATVEAPDVAGLPPFSECLTVVTGLPRSGTSLLMQMLAAGGVPILSDGLREPDEDNPRGYLEYEPVKSLMTGSQWLFDAPGKGVKIVAPLLAALPKGLPCRVIFCERDLDEVLDSQERMLLRRNQAPTTPERRRMLKEEYRRLAEGAKAALIRRPSTRLLAIAHRAAISEPLETSARINAFLGGGLDVSNMAAAVAPGLYRNRAGAGNPH